MDSHYQSSNQQGPPTLNPDYYDAVAHPHPAIINDNLHISGLGTPDDSPIDKFTRKALLVMNINVGDGKRHSLPVMEDDDPYDLARRFCLQYGLNDNVIDALAQNIYDNMEQVLQESVNVIQQSYRHSPTPHLHEIQDSPFAKQKRELVEPDHQDEQFKRFHGAEDDEPLEQIEKQFSDEADESQKPSQYTSVDPHDYKSPKISHQQFAQRRSSINAIEHQEGGNHPDSSVRFGSILTEDARKSERTTATGPGAENEGRRSYNKNWDNEIKLGLGLVVSDPKPRVSAGYAEYHHKTPPRPKRQGQGNREDLETPTNMKYHVRSSLQSTPKKDSSKKKSPNKAANLSLNKTPTASPLRSGHSPRKSPQSFFGIPENVPYEQISLQRDLSVRSRVKGSENNTQRNRSMNANERSPSRANVSSTSIYSNSRRGDSMMVDNKKDEIKRTKSASRVRAEIDGCTFEPKINKLSERIATEKDKNRSPVAGRKVYDKLYNLHKIKEAVRQEQVARHLDDECTFTPSINNYGQTPVTKMSFEERNKKFVQRSKKIEEINKHKERYDPKTGKPLFHPQTGRGPAGERNQQRLPIGDYLYNKPTQAMAINQAINQSNNNPTTESPIKEVRNKTEPSMVKGAGNDKYQIILDNTAKTKFERIFYDLDSDHDGYISATHIDINPIEPDVLQVVAPLLCSMEEMEQSLSLDEFVEQALIHLKGLPSSQRNRFIYGAKFNSHHEEEDNPDNYTFKPEINKKSVELAKNKRPTGGDLVTMYDKQMREKLAREQRLKMEQERRQQQELQDCSFRPVVNKKSEKMAMAMAKKWTVTPVEYRFD